MTGLYGVSLHKYGPCPRCGAVACGRTIGRALTRTEVTWPHLPYCARRRIFALNCGHTPRDYETDNRHRRFEPGDYIDDRSSR